MEARQNGTALDRQVEGYWFESNLLHPIFPFILVLAALQTDCVIVGNRVYGFAYFYHCEEHPQALNHSDRWVSVTGFFFDRFVFQNVTHEANFSKRRVLHSTHVAIKPLKGTKPV